MRKALLGPGGILPITLACTLLGGSMARGEIAVVPDLNAPDELQLEASAISLLVRASLQTADRQLVSRQQLRLFLEGVQAYTPGKSLLVPAHIANQVLAKLGGDRLVLFDLAKSPAGFTVGGIVQGTGTKKLARIFAEAPTGAIGELAGKVASKIAPVLGMKTAPTPDLGLVDLSPFARAETGHFSGDSREISKALDLALPQTAAELPALREILEALADDPSLTALPRAQAKLLLSDWLSAEALAQQGLASDPKQLILHAIRARSLAALKKFDEAEKAAAELKANRTLSVLANLSIGLHRGDDSTKNDATIGPLIGRPAVEWRPVLALIAATPQGILSPASEIAALSAAEKLAPLEPTLATLVAKRAYLFGTSPSKAAGMIQVRHLSTTQIQAIRGKLQLDSVDAAELALGKAIQAREEEERKIKETDSAAIERPTGPPSALAIALQEYLQRFDSLYEPAMSSVTIAPLPGSGGPIYWPFFVRPNRLHEGLSEALMRQPWELSIQKSSIATDEAAEDRFAEGNLSLLAKELGTSGVLFYRIRPAGFLPWVSLELLFHDVAKDRTDRLKTSLVGRATGLVWINPAVIVVALLAIGLSLLWTLFITFRGAITVRVQWDPDVKDELFCLLISKSSRAPVIDNPIAFRKKLESMGQRKRRYEAWNIDQSTTFKGIPKGRWYVYLFGTYIRGRQVLALIEPGQATDVRPRKHELIVFSLESSQAEFKIAVVDSQGAVENARVWVDDERAKALPTGKDGTVSIKVSKGYHVFHVSARELTVDRPYHVVKSKVHEMTVNLVWERRQEFIARALERQVDDADQYRNLPPSATGAPQTTIPADPPMDLPPVDLGPSKPASPERAPINLRPLSSMEIPRANHQLPERIPPDPGRKR